MRLLKVFGALVAASHALAFTGTFPNPNHSRSRSRSPNLCSGMLTPQSLSRTLIRSTRYARACMAARTRILRVSGVPGVQQQHSLAR